MSGREADYTEHLIRARKQHACHGYRCSTLILAGQDYVRAVAFPGHDANGSARPWVMKLCISCATEFDRPLPPRRTQDQP